MSIDYLRNMQSKILLEPPQKEHYSYNRLISTRNVIYFVPNSPSFLTIEALNSVDKNLRVLALFLLDKKIKISNFQATSIFDKQDLENAYNAVKTEEKLIRNDSITLYDMQGNEVEYHDKAYRIRYPSFDAFCIDYVKSLQEQFICFSISRKNNANVLKENSTLFDKSLHVTEEIDFVTYTIKFDSSETAYSEALWRRYTEIVVKLLTKKAKDDRREK